MVSPDCPPPAATGAPSVGSTGLDQPFEKGSLVALRSAVAAHGDRLGLAGTQLDDMLLIAHELASNAIQHGGGRGRLWLWRQDGTARCRVVDWGNGLAVGVDAGLTVPTVGAVRGRGLWLVRQLADEVELQTGDGGTSVTATIRLPGT